MEQPDSGEPALWHVTLTVAGEPVDSTSLRDALERLAAERPFMVSMRYGLDRAELRYWDEARSALDTTAIYTIDFNFNVGEIFDLWIDDIAFY